MQKLSLLKKWDNLSPYRKLIFGFLIAIFIGVILLKMPFSLRENQNISVLDSLFTIVSAICVTGLSVVDVSQVFTSTGWTWGYDSFNNSIFISWEKDEL